MKKAKGPTFEERIERLQEIVKILESGSSPLEESVSLYKEGLEHAAACRRQLEQTRHDIKICTEAGLLPFEEGEAGASAEDAGGPEEEKPDF
ncbi:MAG: exodeoxyribonuclease VII small subunit [Mailhella sp.]|nr:exodeoxyribonuclease VII small subunit [Mailhella sp.]